MHKYAVLYHRGCNDGLASAWMAKQYFGDEAIYLPYQYGDKVPDAVNGLQLFLVDLSMPAEQLIEMAKTRVPSIMVIDHHKTAKDSLKDFPSVCTFTALEQKLTDPMRAEEPQIYKYFSTAHCGAILTWAFFAEMFPADAQARFLMPQQLIYIDDYDRWVKQYPETDAINAWLINGKSDIDRVGEIMSGREINPQVLAIGQTLIDYDRRVARSVIREYVVIRDIGLNLRCAWVNAPHHLRNVIGDMLIAEKKAELVVCYTMRREKVIYSMRANEDFVDAAKIAEMFNGGGHAASAAFAIPRDIDHGYAHFNLLSKPTWRERVRFAWSTLWRRGK